jgi:cytochrome c-type biogenesis protein
MVNDATLWGATGIAFIAGLSSFLSPCVLPLAPVYLASLAGPGLLDPDAKKNRLGVFLHSLSFVLGLTLIFSLWGTGAGLIGSALITYASTIQTVVGIVIIVFGVIMIASLKVSWLNFERRLTPSLGSSTGYMRSFLTGSIFCFAWTPCVGPQLSGILTMAAGSGTVLRGTYLLAVYSLGLGIPFLILGGAFDFVNPLLRKIGRYTRWIYVIAGVLLITVGILILTNKMNWIMGVF